MQIRFIALLCLAVLSTGAVTSTADDATSTSSWPQWGGPNRDHKSQATGLMQEWPEGGPKVAWKFSGAGIGFSSFAVADGQLLTMSTIDDRNYVLCLDSNNGQEEWRTEIAGAQPSDSYLQAWGGGPRGTPTITGDKVIALDDGGTLVCLKRDDGSLIWKVNLVDDFGGNIPKWGYSESPLVDGDRVIVCPGKSKYLVALDLETGRELMHSNGFDATAHYVSVIKHRVGSVDMYITASQPGLVGFDADSGQVLWTNGSSGNGTATIPDPVVDGNKVYHTSDYGTGCVLVELKEQAGKIEATEVYTNKVMQNHHGGVVLLDGLIFGLRKSGGWVCQDFETGEKKWSKRLNGDGSASVAYADGRLYVYGESTGTCYLVEPSGKEWLEKGQLSLPEKTEMDRKRGKIWAHPVIAEGKLFLRDLDLIYAFDISK